MLQAISRSAFDLRAVLDTLVQEAARLLAIDGMALFRAEGDKVFLAARHFADPAFRAQVETFPVHDSIPGGFQRVLATRRPVAAMVHLDAPWFCHPAGSRAGLHSAGGGA